jgi:hypothetical protein
VLDRKYLYTLSDTLAGMLRVISNSTYYSRLLSKATFVMPPTKVSVLQAKWLLFLSRY